MSMNNPNRIHAVASVLGNPAGFFANRGFASVVRSGLGNWTLTYDQPIDPLEAVFLFTPLQTPGAIIYVGGSGDTSVQVLAVDGLGAALDADFMVEVVALSSRG